MYEQIVFFHFLSHEFDKLNLFIFPMNKISARKQQIIREDQAKTTKSPLRVWDLVVFVLQLSLFTIRFF